MSMKTGARQTYATPQQRPVVRPEEIQTRRPMLAASLQMQRGWDSAKGPRTSRWFWDIKPDTRKIPNGMLDLTGVRSGRMVCVGLAPEKRGGNKAAWIVRCDCGMYESRTAKALRSEQYSWRNMCTQCGYTFNLRRKAYKADSGRWPTDDEERGWLS